MEAKCDFCERLKELTFHHYIPKTLHNNKLFRKLYTIAYMRTHGVYLCKKCHKMIHICFTEKELGKNYNSKEKLFSDKRIRDFVNWIKKQD